jgi:hypothetical protein
MNSDQHVATEKWATGVFFIVVIFALGLLSASRWAISSKTVSTDENRRLAACPHLSPNLSSIEHFPQGFNDFYNDRFAFRSNLLSAVNFAQYKLFGCSSNSRVLVGRHDWLYFCDGGDEETLRGVPAIKKEELEYFVRIFEARRAWLAARKIRYLLFFPPSKCTVYREHVPDAFSNLNKRSRQDEMLAALRGNTRVEIIDVRPALLKGKAFAPMYYKTDTHWNRLGSFVCYLEVINRIRNWFPSIRPLKAEDLNIFNYRFGNGDLASMMGLRDLLPEVSPAATLKYPRAHYSGVPRLPNLGDPVHAREPFATEVDDPTLPKAICFRDSFMQIAYMYFQENFRRIRFQWQFDFPTALIEEEKPDIVIQEVTERFLARPSQFWNPPEVDRMIDAARFAVRPSNDQIAQTKSVEAD